MFHFQHFIDISIAHSFQIQTTMQVFVQKILCLQVTLPSPLRATLGL